MRGKLRQRLTYANVVSTMCLFLLLGGTAAAVDGSLPGQNTVGSEDIINGEVENHDLAANSVGSDKIIDGKVKNSDLGPGAADTNTINDNGVRSIDVRDDTLAGGGLTGNDIDESSLGIVPNADQLDGLDSSDFASSGDVHTPSRLALNDPAGDNVATTATLVDTGSFQIVAQCLNSFGVNNLDSADVSVSLTNSSLSSRSTSGGSQDIPGGSGNASVLSLLESNGTTTVESANFIAVPESGAALSGFVSGELNDSNGGGSDCTFGASLVG